MPVPSQEIEWSCYLCIGGIVLFVSTSMVFFVFQLDVDQLIFFLFFFCDGGYIYHCILIDEWWRKGLVVGNYHCILIETAT